MVSDAASSAPVRRSLANTVVHSWKGRFEVTMVAPFRSAG